MNLNDFVLPNYNGKNFTNVINTVKEIYGINKGKTIEGDNIKGYIGAPKKVVFLLVDAFGWKFYDKVKSDSNFFNIIGNGGIELKITSQFPSTTTAHVTSVITGEEVSNHGLFEWYTYDPNLGEIIIPFLYDHDEEKNILPANNLFSQLNRVGVKSTIINPSYINNSKYSKFMFKDGDLKGYDSTKEMFEMLISSIKKDTGKNFYYVYFPNIDSKGHEYGMSSCEAQEEINKFMKELDLSFNKEALNELKDTLFIMTADHGQMELDLDKIIYINKIVPNIHEYFLKKKDGSPIVPVGYNRDMFLYIKEDKLNEVKTILNINLRNKADIYTLDELVGLGVFTKMSKEFKERVGNLIILPHVPYGVWWYEEGKEVKVKGSHGGLSREEMEIPLLIYRFN